MLEGIKTQLDRLIALYEAEKAENLRLRARIDTLGTENDTYRKQLTELEEQIDNLRLKQAFSAPAAGTNPETKAKLGRMIREIDKCISLLES